MYSFRIRGNVSPRASFKLESNCLLLTPESVDPPVYLSTSGSNVALSDATTYVIRADGYLSEENARSKALQYRDAVILALTRFRIAVNFGDRAYKGFVTDAGLREIKDGTGHRVLNDVHGLMVFKTEPFPTFVSATASGRRLAGNTGQFAQIVNHAVKLRLQLKENEHVAYDLFSHSFFTQVPDVRLLSLMMALESLLDPKKRSDPVIEHIEKMIQETKVANALPDEEKQSLLGAIKKLEYQSIRQAGRELSKILNNKTYKGYDPASFFSACYDLRSKIIHGECPRPTMVEVDSFAVALEIFVSDLLSIPISDIKEV